MKPLPKKFFEPDATIVAKKLLGKVIKLNGCSGMIIETEAYTDDEASHAHNITPRSKIMQDTYGHWYVYFIYGNHHCLNVTTNKGSRGAVLIRALKPLTGISTMKKRRKKENESILMNGPGKLCQALNITKTLNGKKAIIYDYKTFSKKEIEQTPRVGIKKATHLLWRYVVKKE